MSEQITGPAPAGPFEHRFVSIRLLQGHRGRLLQVNFTISREMLLYSNFDGQLESIASEMDRQMLADAGHVDPYRLWVTDEYIRQGDAPLERVHLLNGPKAGRSYDAGNLSTLRIPLGGGCVAGYQIYRIGTVRVGVYQVASTDLFMEVTDEDR